MVLDSLSWKWAFPALAAVIALAAIEFEPPPPSLREIARAYAANHNQGQRVTLTEFSSDAAGRHVESFPQLIKTDQEWRTLLTPRQFALMREGATEVPYTSQWLNQRGKGLYRCAACGAALFSSDEKFDSKTGWPSFTAPIAEGNIRLRDDHRLTPARSEILCARCDAHHGHVFPDGPPPTYKRYCVNGAGIIFQPASSGRELKTKRSVP